MAANPVTSPAFVVPSANAGFDPGAVQHPIALSPGSTFAINWSQRSSVIDLADSCDHMCLRLFST
jgi:hypothetical protein